MALHYFRSLRPATGRRHTRFERAAAPDRLATPSDLVLRDYTSVKGLHR